MSHSNACTSGACRVCVLAYVCAFLPHQMNHHPVLVISVSHTHTRTHPHPHAPAHAHTRTHTHTHTHTHTRTRTLAPAHAHTHTHSLTHSLTHAHTHTHTCLDCWRMQRLRLLLLHSCDRSSAPTSLAAGRRRGTIDSRCCDVQCCVAMLCCVVQCSALLSCAVRSDVMTCVVGCEGGESGVVCLAPVAAAAFV